MSAAAIALSVALIGLLGTIAGLIFKNSKKSPERITADYNGFNLLNGGLQAEVTRLGAKALQQDSMIEDLKAKLGRLADIERSFRMALSYIEQLVKQVVALGGVPVSPPFGLQLDEDALEDGDTER